MGTVLQVVSSCACCYRPNRRDSSSEDNRYIRNSWLRIMTSKLRRQNGTPKTLSRDKRAEEQELGCDHFAWKDSSISLESHIFKKQNDEDFKRISI